MRQSRHRSAQSVLGYIEPTDLWRNNVTERVFRERDQPSKLNVAYGRSTRTSVGAPSGYGCPKPNTRRCNAMGRQPVRRRIPSFPG